MCGEKDIFTSKRLVNEKDKYIIITANGEVEATHVGDIKLTLENNVEVIIRDVLFWEGAPNILSVTILMKKGINLFFADNRLIYNSTGEFQEKQAKI